MKSIINFFLLPVIFFGAISIANAQEPMGYLISVTSKNATLVNSLSVPLLRHSYGFFGYTKDSISRNLFLYPAGTKDYNEINKELQANSMLNSFVIVPLHEPLTKDEISLVNRIFKQMKINTESNSANEWTNFFKTRLHKQYTYQLIFNKKFDHNKNEIFQIKRTKDIPAFTKLKQVNSIPDTTYKSLDMGSDSTVFITDTVLVVEEEKDPPPPPPPPPLKNLKKMTDHQIKQWLQKQGFRKVKENQIHIKRSASEIEITIDFGDFRDTFSYPIK